VLHREVVDALSLPCAESPSRPPRGR